LGHLIVAGIGPWITRHTGVAVGLLSAAPLQELLLVPFMIGVAILAGILPALAAYRTDVAKWL
jgi:putative ABC transport system permease protein